jgi:hypothetical protein
VSYQVPGSESSWPFASVALRIVLLLVMVFGLLSGWRRFAKQTFGDDDPPLRVPTKRVAWPLRPSNLLIAMGVGLFLYDALSYLTESSHSFGHGAELLVLFGFVLRSWENSALRETVDSDANQPPDSDSSKK